MPADPETPERLRSPPARPAAWVVLRPGILGALLGGLAVYGATTLWPLETAPPIAPPGRAKTRLLAVQPVSPVSPVPFRFGILSAAMMALADAPVTLRGSVVDEQGSPIDQAIVLVTRGVPTLPGPYGQMPAVGELGVTTEPVPIIPSATVGPPTPPPGDAPTTRTDSLGEFTLRGVQHGYLQVFVTHAGFEPAVAELDALKGGESPEPLKIVLHVPVPVGPEPEATTTDPSLARIGGMVLDRLGRAVAGAFVRTDEGEAATETDDSGGFMLEAVEPGALRIVAEDGTAGQAQSHEVRARSGETLDGVRVYLPGRHVNRRPEGPATHGPAVRTATGRRTEPSRVGGVTLEQRPSGAFVSQVVKASTAGQAGLLADDELLRIDNEAVLSAPQAIGMLRDPAGAVATVQARRAGKRVTLRFKRPPSRFEALR